MTAAWRDLRGAESARVHQAAAEAHAAARIVGSFGKALAEPKDDWAHVSLSWVEDTAALWGAPAVLGGLRAGLRLAPLTLQLGDDPSGASEALDLAGRSSEEAYAWMASEVMARMGTEAAALLELPAFESAHTESSSSQQLDDALAVLEAWFSNGSGLLHSLTANIPQASPVRCWPHHFDISTLITLDPGADPEVGRSVGVGFSAGDGAHPEPYAYVLPWPRPGTEAEPQPFGGVGEWVSDDWFGARVSRSALTATGDPDAQRAAAVSFVREAVREAYRLIGADQSSDILPMRECAREETGA